MKNYIRSMLNTLKNRPLHEKILFFILFFSIAVVMVYYICYVPYMGNSETFHPLIFAKEIIRTGKLIPTDWTFRNEIWSFTSHLLFIVPALFTNDASVCVIAASSMIVIGSCVAVIYLSRSISSNNCWLIFLAILWCGMSGSYVSFMFKQHNYMFVTIIMCLIYVLIAKSVDDQLKIKSWKKILVSCLIIALIGVNGMRSLQIFFVPIAGGLILYYLLNHISDNNLLNVVKDKGFRNMMIGVGVIFVASAIGFITYFGLISNNIVGFFQSTEGRILFVDDIGANLHKLLKYFINICGIEDQSNLFSVHGIAGVFKILVNILMLLVFPILQLKKYNNESTGMKLFMLFAFIHAAEILFLSIFCSGLMAERYLYTTMILLYYLSSHYVFKYIICGETNFGIKSLVVVSALVVFTVPSTVKLVETTSDYEDNIRNSLVVTNFLQNKGLSYGYGSYWNSDNLTAYSDFKVKVNKVRVNKTVYAHHFMSSSYDYSEEAHQGATFLLLNTDENEIFLAGESYVKFGKPTEVCTIADYTVYIYDYNIANNNFRGEYAGFTGSELETISAACRENNVDLAFVYDAGHINTILRGDIDNLEEIDGDTSILAVTHENLAEPASKLNISVGEFSLYICKMSQLEYTPNPNYVAGSDFNSGEDLKEWAIGGGETAVCDNGVLTVTCTKESDRRFNQTVTISEEQVGSPMIFSFKVNKVSGSHVSRVYGVDFSEDRYVTATITEPGIYSFSFVPTSTQITVQPIVPSTLGSSAEIDWVKLENGNIFTGYVPFAVDTNLAEGSDSQDGGGREDLATDGSETADVNPNLAAGSDFQNNGDLEDWIIGGGETAVCEDGALMLTCSEEKDRRFDQIIKISDEQIGKPMTLSYEISGIDGYVLTRVWGEDFKEDRWISEAISEPGVYMFTFTPTSGEFTIQPALPEKLNNSVSVEWVKLETGSDATDFVPYAA